MSAPVLIVGAGPVGLTLACELTRYKVPVRIVDKAPQRTDKSKAIERTCGQRASASSSMLAISSATTFERGKRAW
jgi:2-polyprenyl-6-methoxyphenol hydroxylase-like FAD-dependent oxidoreductase